MKKILLIGGTHRSGSTLLSLMLGSHNNFAAVGEINVMLIPVKKKHLRLACSCGKDKCAKIWQSIKSKTNIENIYTNILSNFNYGNKFLVDSSKSPYWIYKVNQNYKNNVVNILIYKDPLEYGYSIWKRKENKNWRLQWILYHFVYLSIVENPIVINYREFVSNPFKELKKILNSCGEEISKSQFEYWNYEHHILFGSSTAKKAFNVEKPGIYYEKQYDKFAEFKSKVKANIIYSFIFEIIIIHLSKAKKINSIFKPLACLIIMFNYLKLTIKGLIINDKTGL